MGFSTFISYSRHDEHFARRLAVSLSDVGIDVWIDVDDIPAGMKWSSAVQQGLKLSHVMIVIISPDAMASPNVEDEWQYFLDQRKPVIPLLWRPAERHFQLSRIQYIAFHGQPYNNALLSLFDQFQRLGFPVTIPQHLEMTRRSPRTHASEMTLKSPPRRRLPMPPTVTGTAPAAVMVPTVTYASRPVTQPSRPADAAQWTILGAMLAVIAIALGAGLMLVGAALLPSLARIVGSPDDARPSPMPSITTTGLPGVMPADLPPSTAIPTLSFTVTADPAPSSTVQPTDTPLVIAPSATNVRSGDATSYPVIAVLEQRQSAVILGRNRFGNWWYIELEDRRDGSTRKRGWISAPLVDARGDLSALPIIDPANPPR